MVTSKACKNQVKKAVDRILNEMTLKIIAPEYKSERESTDGMTDFQERYNSKPNQKKNTVLNNYSYYRKRSP